MGKRVITYQAGFLEELVEWKYHHDLDVGGRVVELIEQVMQDRQEKGRPKRVGGLPRVWSRRITSEHRLFYMAKHGHIHFLSCRGHELPQRLWDDIRKGDLTV